MLGPAFGVLASLGRDVYTRPILMTPNLTNMTKITTLQALIESSMPAELKKCNGTRKKFAWKFKFAH